jgi:hypothetical protein
MGVRNEERINNEIKRNENREAKVSQERNRDKDRKERKVNCPKNETSMEDGGTI